MVSPKVSVIMTAYNAVPYLRPAIDGLLAQTLSDFEIVVIENGSTDGTRDVLRSYGDARLRLVELDENIGRTPGLRLALAEAKGTYVANLDADDIAYPERLEQQAGHLDKNPDCVLVSSWCNIIDEDGAVFRLFEPATGDVRSLMASENPIMHSAAMFRRDAAGKAGGYQECYLFAQDFGLWVSLAALGTVWVLPSHLAGIREHGGQMTVQPENDLLRRRDAIAIMETAATLPFLTKDAYRAGRRATALHKAACAQLLWKLGRRGEAVREAAEAFLRAPMTLGRRACRNLNVHED